MQQHISHPICLRIMQDLLERIPRTESGTYNRADPTAYSKGWIIIQGLHISFNNCGWGIEIEIYTSTTHGTKKGIELASIYMTDENRKDILIPRKTWHNKWFGIISKLLPYMEVYQEPDYSEDPMGSPYSYM